MTIETNIPIPKKETWEDFPFHKLEVGHSFFKKGMTKAALDARLFKWRLEHDLKMVKKFYIKAVYDGVRVWRKK